MDTSEVMRLALDMAGMKSIPADSGIWVPGRGIKKALFAIDAGPAEINLAKQQGYDLLIAHHPVGPARLTFHEVAKRHVKFMTDKGVPKKVARRPPESLSTGSKSGRTRRTICTTCRSRRCSTCRS